MISLRMHTAQF